MDKEHTLGEYMPGWPAPARLSAEIFDDGHFGDPYCICSNMPITGAIGAGSSLPPSLGHNGIVAHVISLRFFLVFAFSGFVVVFFILCLFFLFYLFYFRKL